MSDYKSQIPDDKYQIYDVGFKAPKAEGWVLASNPNINLRNKEADEQALNTDSAIQTFNLQLFARPEDEGRTEQPTPRKIQRARARGQVAKSTEFTSAGLALITIVIFSFIGYYMFTELVKFVYTSLSHLHENKVNYNDFSQVITSHLFLFFKIAVPIMVIAYFSALLLEISQVGLYFAPRALIPDFMKLKPNFGRVFNRLIPSKVALVEYGKTFFKVGVIAYFTYQVIKSEYHQLILLMDMDVLQGFLFVAKLAYQIIIRVALFLLLMSLFDYFYQRHEHRQGLMMSRYELKDEWKQLEGDPLMRSRVRQRQHQMATRRMMAEVPEADVVITNPVHLAVALKYDTTHMNAPVLVAKGMDYVAAKIVEIATEHEVPLVENKPLAQALYDAVEVGQQVTPELYQAVAEVLAFVYQLKQKSGLAA